MAKRSKVLVDASVQWALGRRIIMHWAMFIGALVLVNTFLQVVSSLADTSIGTATLNALISQTPMLLLLLILMPIFVYDTLKLSNRFAGPITRLRGSIAQLSAGETTRPLKFRDGDFWQEMADEFNVLRERLESLEAENRRQSSRSHDSENSELQSNELQAAN
ncbi:hypothetical protein FF011L_41780 [Roseimaritima multifibrata]|uniref:HAMP domain-containing protein n=1 Tax=Roseimaritima multifibrata TaxID=1930274 RepID=A0A517MKG8_9BACT|nr:hypothetical protein [Roseimaritima multifibrata]QDS95382.1 hypothetical protein FF011L_41780 [Roseimaritima multifibrata]